jgi:hypothetical protein
MSWWSRKYTRPLKDPLLQEYTIEELLYEFHIHDARDNAYSEYLELETDKIEEEKEQETMDWIEEEERKEREALEAARKTTEEADEQWMIEQLKKENGDDFGEDINVDFSE